MKKGRPVFTWAALGLIGVGLGFVGLAWLLGPARRPWSWRR
jgi:hypothetical protein